MIFIVGTGRNGSQMLARMLNFWSDVAIVPESHFVIPLYDKYKMSVITVGEFLDVAYSIRGSEGQHWIDVMLKYSSRKVVNLRDEFNDYCLARNGTVEGSIRLLVESFFYFLYGDKKVIGDKTPGYGANLSIIKQIWPEAKVVYLVRDGVDTAESMLRHLSFRYNICNNIDPADTDRSMVQREIKADHIKDISLRDALKYCEKNARHIENEMHAIDDSNKIVVQYEDLLLNPREELRRVIDFIGIKYRVYPYLRALSYPNAFPNRRHIGKDMTGYRHERPSCDGGLADNNGYYLKYLRAVSAKYFFYEIFRFFLKKAFNVVHFFNSKVIS